MTHCVIYTLLLFSFISNAQPHQPENCLKGLAKKLGDHHAFRTLQFTQKTEQYRGDSLWKTANWYELLVYPDVLRIDIDDTVSGNYVLWRNDSLYRAKKGKLVQALPDTNALLHVLGGWKFRQEMNGQRWKQAGINPTRCFTTRYKRRKVWVIGASKAGENQPQVWIDARRGYTHKVILRSNSDQWQEIICLKHKKIAGRWVETQVDFYLDGKLVQREFYQDIQVDKPHDGWKTKALLPDPY